MKIRTVSRLLTLFLSLMSVLSLGMFLWSTAYMERCQASLSRQLRDTLSAIQFRQGSDVLTASVRAYAATGDERYRHEFDTELTQLMQRERAIQQLLVENDNVDELALMAAAKRASDDLVELEQRIFKAGSAHHLEEAIALAYGAEYQQKKTAVLAPITQAITSISERRSAEVRRAIAAAGQVRLAAIAVTVLNVCAVLAILLGYFMRRVVMPLSRIGKLLGRLDAGEPAIQFQDASAAAELREFAALLEKHVQVVEALNRQSQGLEKSHRQQRAIFNAASSGIAFTRDRTIIDCNELLAQLLGYSRQGLIGLPTSMFFAEALAPEEVAQGLVTILGKEVHRYERQLRRRDGQTFWTRISGKMLDPDDLNQGSVWMIDDISAERAATERMELARRLADEVVELKANFLANMSHEIRTPMSAILGMVHLLGKTELNGRQLDYLRRIDIASKHLLGLLNAVLDFSKIEAGQLQVEAIKFDLPQLCEEVCTMLMADAEAKQLGLTLQVAPGLPRVLIGDPMRLSQIMINYVNNAIKFTERGQVAIRVEGTAQASGALALRVEVRDSGIGLTPEQCGRLFQSFVQAEGATTRRFGGTGLGLAISKGLAALMEGEVGVSSTPEVGSVFWFTALVQVPANAEPGVVAVPGQRPAPQLGLRSAMPFRDGQADVAIQDLWQRISAALGRNEFGVRELFVQNAPQLQSCLGPEYGTLWAAIDQFDFERARKLWHAIQL